ncbi:hypothetical protein I8J29_27655 [Paenibacillus sp. MWE-103]|uniref:Ig-like domain-containing protein n=1 Tax=Paenibacillus artemisiicola TaxID=1172618 RepID=A0ABS3WI21_9BACL|nr:hypothetical protein [Paenibacillus artemisiicola]MBO7747974.1 hypothetical protein [Paenibacillus artemisiicola]
MKPITHPFTFLSSLLVLVTSFLGIAGPASASGQSVAPTVQTAESKGTVGSILHFSAAGLKPNAPVNLHWETEQGSYAIEGLYRFIGPAYKPEVKTLLSGMSDEQGNWQGSFAVPRGFGGDHTIYVSQDNKHAAQNNVFVAPTFRLSPESGPVGTEITVQAEGIGYSTMESNWQLSYDNKMTGLISAVSTNGSATAKIRASGPAGKHTITIWHGYLGMPYVNYTEAPNAYLPVPSFTFDVTGGPPAAEPEAEASPKAAGGGVRLPALSNKPGVSASLSQSSGHVGDRVMLKASGMPAAQSAKLVWHTMEGSRISGKNFEEKTKVIGTARTDANGSLSYGFPIPDDLGGVPHRMELKVAGVTYGEVYLSILPSVVKMTPTSGPAGTEIAIQIKGVGWTEYDNAYYLDYDNAYLGYMCGFNSQGTATFTIVASGEPGYHLIDLYPGIYRGEQRNPDVYLAPQLTYGEDHPGSAIPAIRLGFAITE